MKSGLVLRLATAALFGLAANVHAVQPMPTALGDAIASPARTEAFRARDPYRHPQETLAFFDVQPSMTVVEIWPGGGWYTEILAPYLKDKGQYIAAGFALNEKSPAYQGKSLISFIEKLRADPARFGKVGLSTLGAPDQWDIAPAGSADRVLTFRNVHNWMDADIAPQVFAAMFKALKKGGVLGVVEHRAIEGTSIEKMKESGYVSETEVKRLALEAGFKFESASEINANPKDTKDYAKGVWTLPPRLAEGDKDKDKYLAIGESDRMTLRFVKP
ncbi:MAG: methyltransferase [Pseudomonadota bacterium]